MDARQHQTPEAIAQILKLRIKGLDDEEIDAIHKVDWVAARKVSLMRAPLNEIRQRVGVPKRS